MDPDNVSRLTDEALLLLAEQIELLLSSSEEK